MGEVFWTMVHEDDEKPFLEFEAADDGQFDLNFYYGRHGFEVAEVGFTREDLRGLAEAILDVLGD